MFFNINNINYNVEIKGEGIPLICLHGFSEDLSTWNNLNVNDYKLILIDFIGHGNTDKPKSKKYYGTKHIVKHLNIIISKLGLENYSLLGYSMGGRIALSYALTYPKEIDKLILESTSFGICGFLNRFKRKISDKKLATKIINYGISWFNNHWSNLSIFESQKSLSKDVRDSIEMRRLNNNPIGLYNTLLKSGQGTYPCYKNALSNLKMKVLHISGEYDTKYVQIGNDFAKANSNIKQIIIDGVGHNTHIEDYNLFNKILNEFL